MTLTVSDLISDIKRHLSIIGKRLYTKEGKNLFADITLSSAEDTDILTQYITSSAQNVEVVCRQLITAFTFTPASSTTNNGVTTTTSATISITFQNTRGSADFDSRMRAHVKSYIVLNAVGEYLSMVHPELSDKYYRDARTSIESLMAYAFYKKPYVIEE